MSELIISTEEYKAVCERLKQLRSRQKELGQQKQEEGNGHPSFKDEKSYKKWCEAVAAEIKSNKEKIEKLGQLAYIYQTQASAYNKNRTHEGLYTIFRAARVTIEELVEKLGDNWRDSDKEICKQLRNLEKATKRGEYAGWQSPAEVEAEHAKHVAEVQRLKTQIAGLQSELEATRRSKAPAAHMLARLMNDKQTELEEWRLRRGYTHRIHLTAELIKEIDALL